jgi:hypothetical protein
MTTCGRIDDMLDKFLEVVKKALEERADVDEYCVYERDVRGYIVPRPHADKVYACGAYATLYRSYRLLVVPGAVVIYDVDPVEARCRAVTDYNTVVHHLEKRPHYTVCIYSQPVELHKALVCV